MSKSRNALLAERRMFDPARPDARQGGASCPAEQVVSISGEQAAGPIDMRPARTLTDDHGERMDHIRRRIADRAYDHPAVCEHIAGRLRDSGELTEGHAAWRRHDGPTT